MKTKFNILFLAGNLINFDVTPIKIFDVINKLSAELNSSVIIALVRNKEFFQRAKKSSVRNRFKEIDTRVIFIPRIVFFSPLIIGFFSYFKKIKVIHANNFTAALNGAITKLFFNVKLIYDYHGAVAEEMVDAGFWQPNGFKFMLAKKLEIFSLKKADFIYVISEKCKEYVNGIVKHNKIQVIPSCIKTENFSYSQTNREKMRKKLNLSDKFVIIYDGSLAPWNDNSKMIEIFKMLLNNGINPFFLIITNTPKTIVEKYFQEYSITSNNYLIKNVVHEEVGNYLLAGDLGILIRKNSFVSFVASPMKFAEYLACGLPVLASPNIGDTTDLIKNFNLGMIINNEFNGDELKSFINEVKMNRSDYAGRCSEFAINKFDLKKFNDIYSKVYLQLINETIN
jgi:glycosyltransferase involved in cell wall biosynthesis